MTFFLSTPEPYTEIKTNSQLVTALQTVGNIPEVPEVEIIITLYYAGTLRGTLGHYVYEIVQACSEQISASITAITAHQRKAELGERVGLFVSIEASKHPAVSNMRPEHWTE